MSDPSGPVGGASVRIPYTRDQKLFIAEAMLGFSVGALSTGVFLTSLLLMMGASDLLVGLVTSAFSWALLVSLPTAVVAERVQDRKRLIMIVAFTQRTLTILPAFLPLVFGMGPQTARLAGISVILGACVSTVSTTVFPIFFMDSLPKVGATSYIYTRGVFIRLANAAFSIAAGLLMDRVRSYQGLLALYSIAFALTLLDVYTISRLQGPAEEHDRRMTFAEIRARLFEPLRNPPYLRFLLFTLGYFFFFFAATSYTALYLYKYLGLGYLAITGYQSSILLLMVALTRPWAAVERRVGARRVLVLTSVFLSLDFIVYGFLTPGTLWLLPVSVLVASAGNSGFWICILPYRYALMPAAGKTIYEAWNGTFYAAASLLGALAGGQAQKLLKGGVSTPLLDFGPYQLVFLGCGICAAAVALVFARRAGRAADDVTPPEPDAAGSAIPTESSPSPS